MVKVLHFADLHLGVENYGRPDAATGLHTRLLDFMRSFDELVDYALAEPVDLVLFAGDAYKNRDPNPRVITTSRALWDALTHWTSLQLWRFPTSMWADGLPRTTSLPVLGLCRS